MTRYVAKQHSKKKNDLSKKLLMTSIGTITLISTASILTTPVKADVVTDTTTNAADATSPTSSINESKITTRSTNDTTDGSNSIKTTNDQSNLGTSGTNDISKKDSTGDNTSRENESGITKDTNNPTENTNASLSDNSDAPSQAKVNQSNSQKATSITSTNNSSNQVNQSKIKNVDAGVWMPDQTLRKFIENQISENPQTPANDANLWSYINTPIFSQLTNGVEHNSDGMASLEGLQYATYLNTVELSNTSLMSNGDGLSALTQMPNLSFLSLKNDPSINMSLSNFVNKYISNDTKLMNFTLNTMNVTGSIPDFSNYKKLNNLTLTNLKLTGNIPDFSANTDLSILILAHNQLSGSLPDLSANTSLSDLRINNNLLSGKLPNLTKNPLDRIFLYFNNYFSSSLMNNEGITYGVYQKIPGGNYTVGDGTDSTFDPITGFLFGAQDHTDGSNINNYKYTLSDASTFMPGTKVYLYNSNTGKYDDVSSQFTQTLDENNHLGFKLTASKDAISGHYMIYVSDPNYTPGGSDGYSAFRLFDLNKTILVTSDNPKIPGQPINDNSTITWPEQTSVSNLNKTITENINYQFADNSLASTPVTQAIKYTRSVLVDPATGKVLKITDWKASDNNFFPEVKSPIIPGYTADKVTIARINNITTNSKDLKFTVVYKKNFSGDSSTNNNSTNPGEPDNTSTVTPPDTTDSGQPIVNPNGSSTVNTGTQSDSQLGETDQIKSTSNANKANSNTTANNIVANQPTSLEIYRYNPVVSPKNTNNSQLSLASTGSQLPQTGEVKRSSVSILGMFILGILGLTKFKKRED